MVVRTLIMQEKGIMGVNRCFKKILLDHSLSGVSLAFVGAPSVCLPFAELITYAVRDLNLESCFVPNTMKERARRLSFVEGYGVQLGEKVSINKVKIVAVLGGLAMPGSIVKPRDINNLLVDVLEEQGLVIGVGFNEMFDKANWTDKVKFNYLIDSTIDPVKAEKFSES